MDKKITIPAGIALMVVLAVAGMLAIFSYTAATPVQAVASNIVVTGPDNATETGNVTVMFTTNADIALNDSIVIGLPGFTLPHDFGVTANENLGTPAVASVTFGSTGGEAEVTTFDARATIASGNMITVPAPAVGVDDTEPKNTLDNITDDTAVITIVFPSVTAPAAAGDVSVSLTVGDLTAVTATYTVADYDYMVDFDTPCLLYTSPSPRDRTRSRMPSSA